MRLRLGLSRDQMIRPNEVTSLLRIGKTTLWRWVREGRLPKPARLGPRVVAWPLATIRDYQARAAAGADVKNGGS
jgi:prophage regulatory protein